MCFADILYYYTFYIYVICGKMHSAQLKRKSLDIIGIGGSEARKKSEKFLIKSIDKRLTVCYIIRACSRIRGNYAQNPTESKHDMR